MPPALHHDVGQGEGGDRQQGQQPERGQEGHRLLLAARRRAGSRRRARTNRASSPTQSRSVRSWRWPAPAARTASAVAARWAAAASAYAVRTRRSPVATSRCRPDSGSTSTSWPTGGSSSSRGIEHLDHDHVVAGGEPAQRRLPVERPPDTRRSGSSRSDTTIRSPGRRWRRPRAVSASAESEPGRPVPRRGRRPQHPVGRDPTGQRPGPGQPVAVSVATPSRLPGASVSSPTAPPTVAGQVGLLGRRGAERHARRLVEQQPGVELVLGPGQPHVRLPGPGGDVPVDPAYVVARLVAGQLLGLADPGPSRSPAWSPCSSPSSRRCTVRSRPAEAVQRTAGGASDGSPLGALDGPHAAGPRRPAPPAAAAPWPGSVCHDRARVDALGDGVEGQHQPVGEHVAGDVDHVVGQHVVPARAAARAPGRRPPARGCRGR